MELIKSIRMATLEKWFRIGITLTIAILATQVSILTYAAGLGGYISEKLIGRQGVASSLLLIERQGVTSSNLDIAYTFVVAITDSPASYAFGLLAASATPSTGLTYFTITNNSGFAVNVTIQGTDMTGGIPWVLSDTATAGADTVGFKAGLEGGDYTIIVKKTAPYNTLKSELMDGATQRWGLKMYAPSSFSDGIAKTGTITITGVAV